MKNKIGIIGVGNVGLTILYNLFLTYQNLDIILIDSDKDKLVGNIIDLNHSLPNNQNKISVGEYNDIDDLDVIIISAGIKSTLGRNLFLQKSHLMIQDIMNNILKTKFNGNIIVVSNPNDVLTTYVAKRYQKDKVLGTGTLIDTNRLKYLLMNEYHLESDDIWVVGEHGLEQVILWDDIKLNLSETVKTEISEEVKNIAYKIVSLKGYTNFAVASCVSIIMGLLIKNKDLYLPFSSYDEDNGIAYSYLSKIENGIVVRKKINPNAKKLLLACIKKIKHEYLIFEQDIKIGIDLDDTITFIKDQMDEQAKKFDESINGHGIIDKSKYLVGEQYGWSNELKEKFFKTYRLDIVENAKIRSDVIEVLKKLIDYGYQIIIITARNSKYYIDPYLYTKNWLDVNGIPYTKLIVNAESKKEVCLQENISVFLDDMPENCLEVSKINGISVYIMHNENNFCESNKIKRINNFQEFFREVTWKK